MKQPFSYGVSLGPMIMALMQSTRASSTRRKIDEFQAMGRLVVRVPSSLAMARERRGASMPTSRRISASYAWRYVTWSASAGLWRSQYWKRTLFAHCSSECQLLSMGPTLTDGLCCLLRIRGRDLFTRVGLVDLWQRRAHPLHKVTALGVDKLSVDGLLRGEDTFAGVSSFSGRRNPHQKR